MKIKIRTKEGEFVEDFPHVLEVKGKHYTIPFGDNGVMLTISPILEFDGFEIIEQVTDDTEVTYHVQKRYPAEGQWKFKLWNFNKDLPNEDEGAK